MAEQPARTADTADFTFVVGDRGADVLKVTGFTGEEGISRLFSFRLDLCSDDADIDFAEVLGKTCCLEIAGKHGSRYVHGIVRQFEQTGEGTKVTYYAGEIVPIHWFLTKRFKSRIFRGHNCPDADALHRPRGCSPSPARLLSIACAAARIARADALHRPYDPVGPAAVGAWPIWQRSLPRPPPVDFRLLLASLWVTVGVQRPHKFRSPIAQW